MQEEQLPDNVISILNCKKMIPFVRFIVPDMDIKEIPMAFHNQMDHEAIRNLLGLRLIPENIELVGGYHDTTTNTKR